MGRDPGGRRPRVRGDRPSPVVGRLLGGPHPSHPLLREEGGENGGSGRLRRAPGPGAGAKGVWGGETRRARPGRWQALGMTQGVVAGLTSRGEGGGVAVAGAPPGGGGPQPRPPLLRRARRDRRARSRRGEAPAAARGRPRLLRLLRYRPPPRLPTPPPRLSPGAADPCRVGSTMFGGGRRLTGGDLSSDWTAGGLRLGRTEDDLGRRSPLPPRHRKLKEPGPRGLPPKAGAPRPHRPAAAARAGKPPAGAAPGSRKESWGGSGALALSTPATKQAGIGGGQRQPEPAAVPDPSIRRCCPFRRALSWRRPRAPWAGDKGGAAPPAATASGPGGTPTTTSARAATPSRPPPPPEPGGQRGRWKTRKSPLRRWRRLWSFQSGRLPQTDPSAAIGPHRTAAAAAAGQGRISRS